MTKFKLGIVVGSNRKDSINRKLAKALAKLGDGAFEPDFIRIDDLPLYNQDLEADLPSEVSRFKTHVEESDALLFVTPEHSRSIPTVLKNAIDWGMRPWGKTSWPNKPAAVTGTSPGAIGSAIVQQHLKAVLGAQGLHLMGGEAYITFKPDLVDANDNVTDESVRTFLKAFIDQFTTFASRFTANAASRTAA
jgi:chromate reductase